MLTASHARRHSVYFYASFVSTLRYTLILLPGSRLLSRYHGVDLFIPSLLLSAPTLMDSDLFYSRVCPSGINASTNFRKFFSSISIKAFSRRLCGSLSELNSLAKDMKSQLCALLRSVIAKLPIHKKCTKMGTKDRHDELRGNQTLRSSRLPHYDDILDIIGHTGITSRSHANHGTTLCYFL